MTTLRESILDQIKTTLAGTTGVGTRIWRSRVQALARQETPAIIVEAVSDTPEQNTSLPTLDWSLVVRVSVVCRGEKPDELADPVVQSLHSKIMADLTVGGFAIDVQPQTVSFEMIDADQPAGVISCDYLVRYRTRLADLTQGP